MDAQLARKPDELWTSYLIRRLEAEGISVGEFREPDADFQTELDLDLKNGLLVDLVRWLTLGSLESRLREKHICFSDLTSDVIEDIDEQVVLRHSDSGLRVALGFDKDGTVSWYANELGDEEKDPLLLKYKGKGPWKAEEFVDDVINYIKTVGIVDTPREPKKAEVTAPKTEIQPPSPNDGRLEEILRTVRRLERIASTHPLVMQDDAHYLQELYASKINENPENLKFFEYDGQRIAYVLVHSSDLEGIPGRVSGNLYFVARDKAPEEWQEKIVAFHESLCIKLGHKSAREKEILLAEHLGKRDEYLNWIKEIEKSHQ